ncbi:MAG: hypothetical protein K2Q06_13860, partial [Parvularculaceae bacterium]|nr:hypothetical protein [Parvularculaceae bacterium]
GSRNRASKTMRARITVLSAAMFFVTAATAEPSQSPDAAPEDFAENARLEGKTFAWALSGRAAVKGQCREEWRFGKDGLLTVRSGEETATKRYRLAPTPGESMFALTMTLLSSDGKPDCMGDTYGPEGPPIGKARVTHLQFLNDGSFFTCGSTDGLSCYGVASLRAEPLR